MNENLKKEILALPRADRIQFANELWDSLFDGSVQLRPSQLKFLQRRLTAYLKEGPAFMSHLKIKKKLKQVTAELSKKHSAVRQVQT